MLGRIASKKITQGIFVLNKPRDVRCVDGVLQVLSEIGESETFWLANFFNLGCHVFRVAPGNNPARPKPSIEGSVSPGSTFETNGYWKLIRSSVPFAEDCCDRAVDASVIFLNSSSSSSTNCCRTEISGQTLRFPASSRLSTGKQTSSREEALDDLLEDGLDEPYTEFDSSSSSPEPYESELGSSLYGDVGEEDRFKVDSNGFSVLYWTPLKEWFCLRALL